MVAKKCGIVSFRFQHVCVHRIDIAPSREFSSPGQLLEQGTLSGNPVLLNPYQKIQIIVSLTPGISATSVEDPTVSGYKGGM